MISAYATDKGRTTYNHGVAYNNGAQIKCRSDDIACLGEVGQELDRRRAALIEVKRLNQAKYQSNPNTGGTSEDQNRANEYRCPSRALYRP